MTDITTAILAKASKEFADCFNDFYTPRKLSESGYFVEQVRDAIGRIAFFDFDHELTKDEESEIVAAFFA